MVNNALDGYNSHVVLVESDVRLMKMLSEFSMSHNRGCLSVVCNVCIDGRIGRNKRFVWMVFEPQSLFCIHVGPALFNIARHVCVYACVYVCVAVLRTAMLFLVLS